MSDHDVKFSIIGKNAANPAFQSVKSGLASITKSVFSLKAGLVALVGVGSFSIMAKSAADTADKIQKLSIRLGASTEALSQYRHVATMSGVSFETFTMGLQRMTRRVSEAAAGTGEAKNALEELNVDAMALTQLKPEQQFEALADAIMSVEDPAARVRLAMKLFDSEGVALLQMMQGGSEGLQKMRGEADALGMTMSQDMVDSVAAANDSLSKIKEQLQGIVEQIVGLAAPAVTDIANRVSDWIMANEDLIDQGLDTAIDLFSMGAETFAPLVDEITRAVKDWYTANADLIGQDIGADFTGLADTGRVMIEVFSVVAQVFQAVGKWLGETAAKAVNAYEELQKMSVLKDVFSGMTGLDVFTQSQALAAPAAAAPAGGAAAIAAGGGGGFTGADAQAWNWQGSGGGGASVVNNFNTQVTRSDAVAIGTEMARTAARQ
jgi:hypothetical protein